MGRRAWMLLAVVGVMAMAAVVAVSVLMGGCAKPVETAAGGTVPMKCHWTFVATTLVGAAGVVTALLALAGGGAFAYVKFIKPNRSGVKVSADPDEYDFPDEEYINEDEPAEAETEAEHE